MLKYYADADKIFDCIYILVFDDEYLHIVTDDIDIKKILRINVKEIIQYHGKDIKKQANVFSLNKEEICDTIEKAQEKLIEILFEFWAR
jgi:hypothetical protein